MLQPLLRYCDRGNEVARLQLMLREVSFALEPDGIFGSMTREAVKTFQALHGIPATGHVCPMTWDLLEACQPVYPSPDDLQKQIDESYRADYNGQDK